MYSLGSGWYASCWNAFLLPTERGRQCFHKSLSFYPREVGRVCGISFLLECILVKTGFHSYQPTPTLRSRLTFDPLYSIVRIFIHIRMHFSRMCIYCFSGCLWCARPTLVFAPSLPLVYTSLHHTAPSPEEHGTRQPERSDIRPPWT